MVPARQSALALVAVATLVLAGCVSPGAVQPEKVQPSKVTNLVVSQDPQGGARLTWDEYPLGVADEFRVYRDGAKIATVDAPLRTWLDKTVQPRVSYAYHVVGVLDDGRAGTKSDPVTFTWRESLTLAQDADVNRGYANFSVIEVAPGLRWTALEVRVDGQVLRHDDLSYRNGLEGWTHSDVDDDLVDLGDKLRLLAPGKVMRNRIVEVRVADGPVLDGPLLEGRPTLNLTLSQDARNATAGLVSLKVMGWAWLDGFQDVTAEHPALVPRWSALAVFVNGTRLPYREDGRDGSWWHDAPADNVIREGGRLNLRSTALVHATSIVIVQDAEAGFESFRTMLR